MFRISHVCLTNYCLPSADIGTATVHRVCITSTEGMCPCHTSFTIWQPRNIRTSSQGEVHGTQGMIDVYWDSDLNVRLKKCEMLQLCKV